MLFLTFTNASKPNKQAQLQKKQVMRPKVMTAGYFLIFLSSKVGLASLTIAATTGAQYLLLTNEFARFMEDLEQLEKKLLQPFAFSGRQI